MKNKLPALLAPILLGLTPLVAAQPNAPRPFERTEQREPCSHCAATKMPLFGDLHVHTSYSFDSYISSQRNMLRNVLKDGLAMGQNGGTNPFKMGFIGSTDTHSAIGDVYGKCCLDEKQEPFYSPVIQERAWTSAIWINAAN